MSVEKEVNLSYDDMISTVVQRMEDFESFKKQQDVLLHLCRKLPHKIKGKDKLVCT